MVRRFIYGTLAIAVLMLPSPSSGADCVYVDTERNDNAAIAATKVDYALAVISDANYLSNEKYCVEGAMGYLGHRHITQAIPALTKLLGYRSRDSIYTPDVFKQYPAIGALAAMGDPAVPSLVQTIAEKEASAVESKNAVLALMTMSEYREHPGKAVALLKQAAEMQTDALPAERLRKAADEATAKWCRLVPCTNPEIGKRE